MATLGERVETLLNQAFPAPDQIELRDDDGLIGIVVSDRFEGRDTIDRQALIRSALDSELSALERRDILAIIAVTPLEHAGHVSL